MNSIVGPVNNVFFLKSCDIIVHTQGKQKKSENAKRKGYIQLNPNGYCVGTVHQTLISCAPNFGYL